MSLKVNFFKCYLNEITRDKHTELCHLESMLRLLWRLVQEERGFFLQVVDAQMGGDGSRETPPTRSRKGLPTPVPQPALCCVENSCGSVHCHPGLLTSGCLEFTRGLPQKMRLYPGVQNYVSCFTLDLLQHNRPVWTWICAHPTPTEK